MSCDVPGKQTTLATNVRSGCQWKRWRRVWNSSPPRMKHIISTVRILPHLGPKDYPRAYKDNILFKIATNFANAPADSPEANAVGAIRLFCESGSNSNGGEEVLHLPVIVEAAESSPQAAAAAAQQIRRFLTREWSVKPYVQYNSIMLVRILSDNPGPTFTRNFDKAFVGTVKELLRNCRDQNTQQILRETLDSLEVNKGYDEGLQSLFQMWRKEKGHSTALNDNRAVNRQLRAPAVPQGQMQQQQAPINGGSWHQQPSAQPQYQPVYTNGSQQYGGSRGQGQSRNQLPSPSELASRVEEARNTAKILMQLIQSTPPEEVMHSELIKEFSERCQSAQKSIHGYISCDSPPPDDDTLQTLIETNEQLSLASSRYQRAILAARRAMGASPPPQQNGNGGYMNAPLPAIPPQGESLFARAPAPPQQNPYQDGGQSLFAQPQAQYPPQAPMNGYEGHMPPPGPPPRTIQPYHQPQTLSPPANPASLSRPPSSGPLTVAFDDRSFNDPFADPVDRYQSPAPLAIEPTNYGPNYTSNRAPLPSQSQNRQRQASTTFSTDGGSNYSGTLDRRNTMDLENSYATLDHRRSPSIPSTVTPVSAMSPRLADNSLTNSPERTFARPGPGPVYSGNVTPSYVGRQQSAAEGLTMHGAVSADSVAEIDSHSDVGRRDRERVESGSGEHSPRVDIKGTGGLRSSVLGRS
ncbi:hypothetical protein LTR56_019468 [Elasticomyces elasticus]|nr:hypothetical protein LTR56_019468 [Elasticomyces elasticus]KAK3634762.1 hypothetical protein LTR22_019523 [Elasticomyces elasticus]KAK4924852.1 hypothetical protein LTR49_008073 [Elasticomyces elasticus]KAK5750835.1 hypothetical protein LTS12_019123 [Elasticomyces elasticus]